MSRAITEIYQDGVKIWSRYGDPEEFRVMAQIVDDLPDDACERVSEIFCDTKACASYAVGLRRGVSMRFVWAMLDYMDIALTGIQGGHNGVTAYEGEVISGVELGDIDPNWQEAAL